MFSAKSVYCHRFGWGGCLCVCFCLQYMYTNRSLNARHLCQCVFDFDNVRRVCDHCLSIRNTPEIGHIYSLYRVYIGAASVVPHSRCLLKQHHSLIFNKLLNSFSWRCLRCRVIFLNKIIYTIPPLLKKQFVRCLDLFVDCQIVMPQVCQSSQQPSVTHRRDPGDR